MNSHPHGYGCLSPTGSLTGDFDDLKNLMSQSGDTLKVALIPIAPVIPPSLLPAVDMKSGRESQSQMIALNSSL